MTIRRIVYLTTIVLFSLGSAFMMALTLSQSHARIILAFYPGFVLIFCSCLRLYMLPNELFNPYTGLSENDPLVFKKYYRITATFSMFAGLAIIVFLVKYYGLQIVAASILKT